MILLLIHFLLFVAIVSVDYQAEPDHLELPCSRVLHYFAAHWCHLGCCAGMNIHSTHCLSSCTTCFQCFDTTSCSSAGHSYCSLQKVFLQTFDVLHQLENSRERSCIFCVCCLCVLLLIDDGDCNNGHGYRVHRRPKVRHPFVSIFIGDV